MLIDAPTKAVPLVNGTLTFNPDGTFTYTPELGFRGTKTLIYEVCDGTVCSKATISLVTTKPYMQANPDILTFETGKTGTGNVLTNDENVAKVTSIVVDGTTYNVVEGTPRVVTNSKGTLTFNSDGTYTFEPAPGFTDGDLVISYTGEKDGFTVSSDLTIQVLPGPIADNNISVANNDHYTIEQGGTVTMGIINVLANDFDLDTEDVLSVTEVKYGNTVLTDVAKNIYVKQTINGIEHDILAGTAKVVGGEVSFTPEPGFIGSVPFTYTISDGNGGTDTATATFTVVNHSNSNNIFTEDDLIQTTPGEPGSVNIFNNDNIEGPKSTTVTIGNTPPIDVPSIGEVIHDIIGVGVIKINADGTITFTPDVGYVGTTTIFYTVTNEEGISSTANIHLVSLTKAYPETFVWVGKADANNWNNPNNWSLGIVPIGTNPNIEFATEQNNGYSDVNDPKKGPVVSDLHVSAGITNAQTIGNLTNITDKAMLIPANASLTINGTITGSDVASRIVVKAGNPNGTTDLEKSNGTLIITGMPCTENVMGTVEFHTNAKAGAGGTWKDDITGSPTIGEEFTTKYHWQFFGIPVKEITHAIDYFENAYIREYDETINLEDKFYQKWKNITTWSKMEAFNGYEITHDAEDIPAGGKTYSIQGALNFCNDQTIILTRKSPSVGDVGTANEYYGLGQNIFGNSFTAAINIDKMVFPSQIEETVYLYNTGRFFDWTEPTGGPSINNIRIAGNYLSVPKSTSAIVWDNQIPSMQGFLLKFKDEQIREGLVSTGAYTNMLDPVTMTLSYANDGVVPNTKPQLAPRKVKGATGIQTADKPQHAYLRINLQSNSTVDNLWLFSEAGTSAKFDNGWDGRKFFGTPTAFIFTQTSDGPMQVNTNNTIDGTPITLYSNADTEYTLTLVKSNLEDYQDLHLIDFATNTVTPLEADTTRYPFVSMNKGVTEKRFMIVNQPGTAINLKNDGFDLLDGHITPGKVLNTTNYTGESGSMQLYSITGSLIMTREMNTGTNKYPTTLNSGAYIMKLHAGKKQTSVKILVK